MLFCLVIEFPPDVDDGLFLLLHLLVCGGDNHNAGDGTGYGQS